MAEKKKIVMRIAGEDYKLNATEPEAYLRKVESCVNDKWKALHQLFSVKSVSEEHQMVLTAINLADDYLKAQEQVKALTVKVEKLQRRERQLEEAVLQREEAMMQLETEIQDYAEKMKKQTEA